MGQSVFADEAEAREAFARAEAGGWNCHLFQHAPRTTPNLVGKVIAEAVLATTKNGDQELVIRCVDGSSFTVGAWQDEGYPVQIEVTPNESPAP